MANTLKGLTIEIDGNATPLNTALKDVNKTINSTAYELREVEKLLKLDPTNTTLLAQKQELLEKAVGATADKMELLKTASKGANDQLAKGEIGEAAYRGLQREIELTTQKMNAFKKEADKAAASLKKIDDAAGATIKSVTQVGNQLAAGLAVGLVAAAEATEEYRSDLAKLETNAASAGASMDILMGSMKALNAVTGETDSNVEALSNLLQTPLKGNQLQEAVDILSGAVIAFPDTLKIEGLADGLQESVATGKAMGQFAELLDRTGVGVATFEAGMAAATTEAEKQNVIMQILAQTGMAQVNEQYREQNAALIESKDAQFELNDAIAQLGAQAAPILNDIKNITAEFISWLVDNDTEVLAFVGGLGAGLVALNVVVMIQNLVKAFTAFKAALAAASTAQAALNVTMSSNVFGIVLAAVVALTTGIAMLAGGVDENTQAVNDLTDSYNENTKAIAENLEKSEAEAETVRTLTDRFYDLQDSIDSGKLSAEEMASAQAQMVGISEQLNSLIPNLGLAVDNETGAWNRQRSEVLRLTEEYYNLAIAKARAASAEAQIAAAADQIVEAEQLIADIRSQPVKPSAAQVDIAAYSYGTVDPWEEAEKERAAQLAAAEAVKAQAEADLEAAAASLAEYSKGTEAVADGTVDAVVSGTGAAAQAAKKMDEVIQKLRDDQIASNDEVVRSYSSGAASQVKTAEDIAKEQAKLAQETAEAQEEASREAFEASKQWIEDKKDLNELSAAEELAAWDRVRQRYAEGTDERLEAEKEHLAAKTEIQSQLSSLEDAYADKRMQTLDEIKALEDNYNTSLATRTNEIMSYYGLFQAVEEAEKVSSKELTKNLKDQVEELQTWSAELQALKDRGISEDLYSDIQAMGVSALPQLEALNKMTDEKLTEYSELFAEKQKIANEQATRELEPLKEQAQTEIESLMSGLEEELSKSKDLAAEMVRGLADGIIENIPFAESAASQLAGAITSSLSVAAPAVEMSDSAAQFSSAVQASSSLAGYATSTPVAQIQSAPAVIDYDAIAQALADGLVSIDNRIYQLLADILGQRIAVYLGATQVAEILFDPLDKVAKSKGKAFMSTQDVIDLILRYAPGGL